MYDLGDELDGVTVGPGTNILVAGPPLSGKRRLALEVLAHGARQGEGSIIVTTRDGAERVRADYESLLDADSGPIGIVDCVTKHQGQPLRDTDEIKYTSSPVDMTGIGIRFSEFMETFHEEQNVERNRVLLDSLTTLLLYSNLQTVFRFIHVFTSRISTPDALGIYLIESTAHDQETMSTLRQLFDAVVEVDDDGSVATAAGLEG
ncbi:MAG: RAD55 family ATPase [Haloarculaceae archaeon]